MPTLTELKDGLERALADPDLKAETYARPLRKVGLLTTGGRGTSTPQVTVRDCARLLIAILSSLPARHAVKAVKTYEELELRWAPPGERGRRSARAYPLPAEGLASLPLERIRDVRLFGQVVEFLLLRAIDGSLERDLGKKSGEPQLALRLTGPQPGAKLELSPSWSLAGVRTDKPFVYWRPGQDSPSFPHGLTRAAEIHEDTLTALGRLFSSELARTAIS